MVNITEINIIDATRSDLKALRNFPPKGKFSSFVVVPTGNLHDSGYEAMKFILLNRDKIVGVVSGCSDVIHLNGIGGYGKIGASADRIKPIAWHVDCLPGSGCLHFWCNKYLSIDEFIGSDFCVYVEG